MIRLLPFLLLIGCARPHVYVPHYIPRPNRVVEMRYVPDEHTTHVTVEQYNAYGTSQSVYWEFDIYDSPKQPWNRAYWFIGRSGRDGAAPRPYSCDASKVCVLRREDCASVALPLPPAGVDCSCRDCQPYGRDATGRHVDGNGEVIR